MFNELETEGELFLVGGSTYASGLIEIYHNGTWGTICRRGFSLKEANVACRQLGFMGANSLNFGFGPGFGTIWLDNVNCIGNSTSLADCNHGPWGSSRCFHYEDIGVNCRDGMFCFILLPLIILALLIFLY